MRKFRSVDGGVSVTEPRTNRTRSRKVKALLAGGLVLGVGAAVTLAAWTDQEWAQGDFGAGSFNVQGSTDGENFTDHESEAGAANLSFDLTGGDNLTPGDTVAAPFVMRLDADTTYDATVELTTAAADGAAADALTYGIVAVDSAAACTAEAAGTAQIVPDGTALTSVAGATTIDLSAGAEGAAGAPIALCFQVSASDALEQSQTATANWQFVATSVE